jgi:mannitol 2-dehydrogenase
MYIKAKNLDILASKIKTPQYNRSLVLPGIVHIGLGNFQRSHQAIYTEKVLEKGNIEWGICGVGIMPWDSEIRDALKAQDNMYTLVSQTGDRVEAQIVGSVVEYIYGVDNAKAVVEKLAAPTTRIVSLTVTEKGYSQDQVTGDLDFSNEMVIHDLRNIETPNTAIGYIVAGLNKRFQADGKSFSVVSCDNLQGNGDMTRKLVTQFATELNPELAAWI